MQCFSRLPLKKQFHAGFKAKDYITPEKKGPFYNNGTPNSASNDRFLSKGHFEIAEFQILLMMDKIFVAVGNLVICLLKINEYFFSLF